MKRSILSELLLTTWREPNTFPDLPTAQKELILRQARRAGLLASLQTVLKQANVLDRLSPRIQDYLEGSQIIGTEQERSIRWEVNRIHRAFYGTALPVILLKGAAYVMLNLPVAKGRLVGDVDILLPKTDLPLAQQCLHAHDWVTVKANPYDQHYYREWMHEWPPLRHRYRQTEVDMHHAILPITGRLHPDSTRLLANVQPVPGYDGVWTLGSQDLVLHAMAHLFYDNDFQQAGLRNLLDLDGLLRHYGQNPGFWESLVTRAQELELTRPLYYALHFTVKLCHTPIPPIHISKPGWLTRILMNRLIPWAILPENPNQHSKGVVAGLAQWLLYVRSHWLRMPPSLLLPHLARKWTRRWHFNVWHRRSV
ncbi:MAG: nucleotidyltransferase family protein [Magnetococcales bacterium]|nr:nucleotidyltransferase family protein [Magnetococcales bacterium]